MRFVGVSKEGFVGECGHCVQVMDPEVRRNTDGCRLNGMQQAGPTKKG